MARKNFSITSVQSAPDTALAGTSLIVANGTGADLGDAPFYATAHPSGVTANKTNAEIVKVTAIVDDVYTIERAQRGSTAKAIANGWVIFAGLYAEDIDNIYTKQQVDGAIGDRVAKAGDVMSGALGMGTHQIYNLAPGTSPDHAINKQQLDDGLGAITGEPYNVQSFGAVGDGVADDTAEIQAAIDAAFAAGGGVVHLPTGIYKLTSALVLKDGVSLIGDGSNSTPGKGTVIRQTVANQHALYMTTTTAAVGNLSIRQLSIDNTAGTGTSHGIFLHNNSSNSTHPPFVYMTFADLTISNFRGWGFNAESLIVSQLERVVCITNANGFFLNGDGYNTSNWSSVNTSVAFIACYANGNTGFGYRLLRTTYTSLMACASDSNGTQYSVETCNAISFSGCGAEHGNPATVTPGDSFVIKGGSINIGLYNCFVLNNQHYSLYITGNSYSITAVGFMDNDQGSAAVNGIKVDAGSKLTMVGGVIQGTTSVAANSVTYLDDGAGNMAIGGTGYFNQTLGVAGKLNLENNVSLPAYGQLQNGVHSVLELGHYGTVANYFGLESSPTGNAPTFYAAGTDANISFNIQAKGTGVVNIAGAEAINATKAQTMTNKRITSRVISTTSAATVTINADTTDQQNITAQAAALTIANPTGTPTAGQKILIRIKDDGTARAITWGTLFRALGVTLPTTTVAGKTTYVGVVYNSTDTKYDVIAVSTEA